MPVAQSASVAQGPGMHALISVGGGQSTGGQIVPAGHGADTHPPLAPMT
jgi:hypothetical protein